MPHDVSDSDLYPMRVVARVTGLPADTIRAWERRYGAVEPHRTAGNARRYSGSDIRKLTMLRTLTERGLSIGAIAPLDMDALEVLLAGHDQQYAATPSDSGDPLGRLRRDYMAAVTRMDVGGASRILFRGAAVLDNRELVFGLVIPIVQEVGQRWSDGEMGVAQEHMVSAELRALLATRMRAQRVDSGAPKMVMATPAGHRHEFGVLVAAMLASGRGIDVLYLGVDLPEAELCWTVDAFRPAVVVLGIARTPSEDELCSLHNTLERLSADVDVWLGCRVAIELGPLPRRTRRFTSLEDFDVGVASLIR